MKVLLDTSLLVHLLRGDKPAVDAWEALAADGGQAVLSSAVLFELRHGFQWTGDRLEEAAFEALAMAMEQAPFDDHAARHAAEVQVFMKKQGQALGQVDAMVAGTAAAGRYLLVTADAGLAKVAGMGLAVQFVEA